MAIRNDLTGKKFGRLTVLSLHSSGVRTFWNVRCDCGVEKKVDAYPLHTGNTSSCGCLHREMIRLVRTVVNPGEKHHRLTVIKEVEQVVLPSGQKDRKVLCLCDCGKESVVSLFHLIKSNIKSCGCLQGEQHGLSDTKLYMVWRQVNERCHKPYTIARNKRNYQDRGITVCTEWRESFIAFHKWCMSNGYKPGLQIDRRDNNKGYNPSNCRFVTRKVNMNNTSVNRLVKINGETKTLTEWSDYSGIPYATLRFRIFGAKWPESRWFTPVRYITPKKKSA